ncbi:uncharacterized protein LOC133311217 [Gastrolobium bilobum]|uniref:uncharacterized protein LOC133311217 n=1 Tax=Gastrolobium bilobum TaxID=150636 RepID=UPI002AAF84A4|nr:uncharacterized protein LOC133311217 [Gastrolobium bilobum]
MRGCGDYVLELKSILPNGWISKLEAKTCEMLKNFCKIKHKTLQKEAILNRKSMIRAAFRDDTNDNNIYCPVSSDLSEEGLFLFQQRWIKDEPIIVRDVLKVETCLSWEPKDVSPAKEDWRIKVKVVRAWKVPNFQRKDFDDNVEMVLLDEHGGRIHATIEGSLSVWKKIHEGDCYFIKKIGVGFNNDVFRPTRHQYRLSFNLRTDLRSIVDSNISASEFDFVDYDIVEKETSNSPYLVDVIGLVSGIGEVCERVVSGRKTKMIMLELDNLSLSADGVESSLRMTQLSTQSSYSYENDFLKETEKKSISDVKLCGEVTTCIMYGTIKSIESKYNRWYKSCKKCPFSVFEDFEKWYCKNCQKHWKDYYPRFSVQVRVVDNTDSVSFLLFDRDYVSLLGMSAAELRELHFKRDEANFEDARENEIGSSEPEKAAMHAYGRYVDIFDKRCVFASDT